MAPKTRSTSRPELLEQNADNSLAPIATNVIPQVLNKKRKRDEAVEPSSKRARPDPKPATSKPATSKPATSKPATSKPAARKHAARKLATPKLKPVPKPVPILTKLPTQKLSVFQCGTGEYCELGLGPKATIVKEPKLNEFLNIEKVGVVAIAYGGMHGAALTHDGKVYTWGVNDLGALGRITMANDEMMVDDSDSEDEGKPSTVNL
jgi:regulator of chromosome condensation